ncbi:MAG: hypothetical protein RBT15_10045 [Gudongella sp.]|nr:hypothetical protein [Gudongella sp.]
MINKMIETSEAISDVMLGTFGVEEYYFFYKRKYRWSIYYYHEQDDYYLYYYKVELPIVDLANMDTSMLTFIKYQSSEFKSKEATESFAELYNIVKGKLLGMDDVIDDILNDPTIY